MRYIKSFFFICLMSLSFSAPAETALQVITLQHRFADDLLHTIIPMVGIDGTETGMRNQLILRVAPDRMRNIEMIILHLMWRESIVELPSTQAVTVKTIQSYRSQWQDENR